MAPFDRFPDIAWNRVDGYPVAASTADLAAGTLLAAPNQTPAGTYLPAAPGALPLVWTGLVAGAPDVDHCALWSSQAASANYGLPHSATGVFLHTSSSTCDFNFPHLYCGSDRELLHWDNFEAVPFERWGSAVGGP